MKYLAAIALLLLALPAGAALTGEDFAWRWALDVDRSDADGDHAVFRVSLSQEIYQALHRPDAADVLITDAAGRPVPFARLPAAMLCQQQQTVLPLTFRAREHREEPDNQALPGLELQHKDTRLIVRSPGDTQPDDAWGRLLFEALIAAPESRPQSERQRLHLSFLSDRPVRLDCRLRAADSDEPARTRLPLTVQADSRPLRLVASTALGGDQAWPAAWHVSCYGNALPQDFGLESVALKATETIEYRRHITLQPALVADTGQDGAFHFELNGPYRIDRISLQPAQANVLSRVEVQSRPDEQAPWQRRGTVTMSTLDSEAQWSASIGLGARHRDRHWRSVSVPALDHAPAIELEARAEELVFLAQGQRPWQLYAGSLRPSSTLSVEALLDEAVQQLGPAWQWPLIVPTGRLEAAGESALVEPDDPLPWQRGLLWMVLILGGVILVLMAVRLLRQAKSD